LLKSLYPEAPVSDEALVTFLRKCYTVGAYIPEVSIEGDLIHIHIDEAEVERTKDEYQRIVRLAENGKYDAAIKLISELIAKGTIHSDIYRIYGQILYDQGEFDAALDQFIEALRWNPENVASLIMVGNIYAKQRRDIKSARVFFEQEQT
jgi:tetratricopeptide (TPR) repeat protein